MNHIALVAAAAAAAFAGIAPAASAFNPQPEPPGRTGAGLLTATLAGIEDPNLRAFEAAWSSRRGVGPAGLGVLPGLGKETTFVKG